MKYKAALLMVSLCSQVVFAQPQPGEAPEDTGVATEPELAPAPADDPSASDPASGGATAVPTEEPPEQPAPAPPSVSAGTPPPVAKPIEAIQPKRPLTQQELAELTAMEKDFTRYAELAEDHQSQIKRMLRREFSRRKQLLDERYAKRTAEVEKLKRTQDLRLIALLERFIEDHPDHPKFTPDAMFRLAQLYLSEAEYEVDLKERLADEGKLLSDEEITADYSPALDMWEDIIVKFPKYRLMPSVLYLLAHYGRASDERKSLQVYLSLTCANKFKPLAQPPRLLTRPEVEAAIRTPTIIPYYQDCEPYPGADPDMVLDAWARGIGPHHFNMPGELDQALAAFKKVTAYPDSPLYMRARYNEAWTYYRRDYLPEAIAAFDESVVLYDKIVASGKTPSVDLRAEALQYIAVAFTDPWEKEGEMVMNPEKAFKRVEAYYQGREGEPHTRDVWVTVGQAFVEIQRFDQAIAAFNKAISKPWHLDPENPVVHQEIVDAYEGKGDKYGADQAMGALATRYAPGSEWYKANEKDQEAMENYTRIGERMLMAAAKNTHLAAGQMREEYESLAPEDRTPEDKAAYLAMYDKAAGMYQTFIKQYPESESVYEFMFATAEAKYFGERYLEAVGYYAWVRDHRNLSEKYFEQSALSVIQAYEAEVDLQIAANRLNKISVPDTKTLQAMPKPVQPQQIPQLYVKLRGAWDAYQKLVPDPRSAPKMGLNAALVSVSYLHLDDAERRFKLVVDKFCGTDAAGEAKDGLLTIYKARGETKKFQETNQAFIQKRCGDKKAIAAAKRQNRKLEFDQAGALAQQGNYEKAAVEYYTYYKTAPADDPDLPTALFNAALALRKANKPRSSIALFEEFTKSKNKNFVESPFYLEALKQTARSYQSAYDYRTAVRNYLDLMDRAKEAKKKGLTPPTDLEGNPQSFEQIRLDALYNAASLSELNRDFKQAVTLFKRYEQEERDKTRRDEALWAVARIYRSAGDTRQLSKASDAWRKKYGRDQGNADRYVRSYYLQAKLYERKKNSRYADRYRNDTIDAWLRVGKPKGGEAARLAGEFALHFAEQHYRNKWTTFSITKQARTQSKANDQFSALAKASKDAQAKYLALDEYGILEYSMAAKVRFADILSEYGPKVLQIPTPRYVQRLANKNPDLDVIGKYETKLLERVDPKLQEAKKQWQEVVAVAKKNQISNKWTQLAAENLSREFPSEFEVLHQEIVEGTENP